MTEAPPLEVNWNRVGRLIGVPIFWRLRARPTGRGWTLTADGRAPMALALSCGHRSVQVTAPSLVEAVAFMAMRLRDHRAGM